MTYLVAAVLVGSVGGVFDVGEIMLADIVVYLLSREDKEWTHYVAVNVAYAV